MRTDDVLNSLEGMQRAKPGRDLYGSILNKINNTTIPLGKGKTISLKTVSAAAACLLLLLTLNVLTVTKKHQPKNGMEDVANYYQLNEQPFGL